uniref:Uncharacterized protein n=1 Tax=Candidozyma auris TaxID=498019 RepID=A0A0L0NPT1_CANAR
MAKFNFTVPRICPQIMPMGNPQFHLQSGQTHANFENSPLVYGEIEKKV